MILLSDRQNHSYVKTKVIQVKPVEYFQNQNQRTNHSNNEKAVIEGKIINAKQELEDVKKEKEELIQAVNDEIAKEKRNWQKEKEKWIKKAQEEGYNEGVALGKQEVYNQYKTLLNQANAIIESAQKDYHSIIEKNEETIIDLAIHTAEKIVRKKISDEPKDFINIVKEAIKDLKDQSTVTIYLHPDNYQLVLNHKNELLRTLDNQAALSIYINEELSENACLIEHPFGKIDAGVDTQLEQIRKILQELSMETRP